MIILACPIMNCKNEGRIKKDKCRKDCEVSKKKKIAIASFIVLFLVCCGVIFYFTYRIELILPEYVLELGDEINTDPAFYVKGTKWAVDGTSIDVSNVDCGKEGTYEVRIQHGWQEFISCVVIEDTIPPTLVLHKEDFYLEKNSECTAKMFVSKSRDLSGKVKLSLSTDGKIFSDKVSFDSCGEYTLTIKATDINGNERKKKKTVVVDTAPVFGELPEYYVAVDSTPDFLEMITAVDEVDGDVTEKIKADLSGIDMTEEGIGVVSFSVTDSYGLTAKKEIEVKVYQPENLQSLINHHEINRLDQRIIGAYNLYDAGIYEDDNVEAVLEKLSTSLVRLRKDISGGGYSYGSGFVLEMNEEEVIICTNHHVVKEYAVIDIYFYDGTSAEGVVLGRTGNSATEDDVALVSVKRENIPDDLFRELRTIHVNMGSWREMANESGIDVGLKCVDEYGGIWKNRKGILLNKEKKPEHFEKYGTFTEVSFDLVHGMSGSAVVDGYGNLMGMAVCITTVDNVNRYWCVTLSNLAESYYEITGRCMYYE